MRAWDAGPGFLSFSSKTQPNYTMNFTKPSRARRAFTLIELLTVIAIIGILASILIPVVGKVREQAKVSKCVVHLRDLGTGVHLYANDKGDWTPPFLRDDKPDSEWGSRVETHGHVGLLLAPEKGGPAVGGGQRWTGDYLDSPDPLLCPATREELFTSGASGAVYKRPIDIDESNRIERVGYMYDYQAGGTRDNSRTTIDYPNRPYLFDFPPPGTISGLSPAFTFNPHDNRVNVLHVGGHVTSFTADELKEAGTRQKVFDLMAGEL